MIWKLYAAGATVYFLLGFILNPFTMSVTETDEAIAHLKEKGYLVEAKGTVVLTSAFYEYLNVKEQVSGKTDYKEEYKQFIIDAKVPWRPKGYTVNQYSLTGQKAYERLLKNPKIDPKKLLLATSYYYRTTEYPKTIEKFLTEGIWENVYDRIAASKPLTEVDTSSNNELG